MHLLFDSLDELFAHMIEDKHWTGANASQHDRYPIRFVLFDNFYDFGEFIKARPDGIYTHAIETLLERDTPDDFITYSELSKEVQRYVKQLPMNDYIIFPFSEMARFYNNDDYTEFDALITTIRGTQAPEDAQQSHVRIYIPIVGMQKKMGRFMKDNQTFVWELKSEGANDVYNLVVTNGTTYGVQGLDEKYSYVQNLHQWLELWKEGKDVKRTIISSSRNIYANAHYAQPDNAFIYTQCDDVYEFLVKGLHLDFGMATKPDADEVHYWKKLAAEIDVTTFAFDDFVKERLDIFNLQSGADFIKTWFDCDSDFDRWLLTLYFHKVGDPTSYIYHVISTCSGYSKAELFSNIATLIFEEINKDQYIGERCQVLRMAAERGVAITEMARQKMTAKLQSIATTAEEGGYYMAVRLLTPLTDDEKQLAIRWIAGGKISTNDIMSIYPNIYSYLMPISLNSTENDTEWLLRYFDKYRLSKISDKLNDDVVEMIADKNANKTKFTNWYENIKTVKTILHNRQDIEVYYWIDGLGVDWIPYVRSIIDRYQKEHVYLNEIYIAAASIPTTTACNKPKLQSLLPEGVELQKIGDLDSFAHSHKRYPQYIVDEMKIVDNAITKVLDNYTGKKIAFISDHGISYLSQYAKGLNLAGVEANHEGRVGQITTNQFVADNKYITLDDNTTVSALTHQSLTDKIDAGHGAHGGCTPEEVLVPIIIVSGQKNANNFTVVPETDRVDGTRPTLRFTIKGLTSIDTPTLLYNGVHYSMETVNDNIFESERLNLVETATKVTVCINNEEVFNYNVAISLGASEDDLFADF